MSIYITQQNTGQYSRFNCGCAVSAMACQYQLGTAEPVETIRNTIRSWTLWKPFEIEEYLNKEKIDFSRHELTDLDDMKQKLAADNIIIINVNMSHIPRGQDKNKSYSTWLPWWGHYLVITGLTSDNLHFIVNDSYDPDNGQERLYDVDVIIHGMRSYYSRYIAINSYPYEAAYSALL
jgi:hypothetical protein